MQALRHLLRPGYLFEGRLERPKLSCVIGAELEQSPVDPVADGAARGSEERHGGAGSQRRHRCGEAGRGDAGHPPEEKRQGEVDRREKRREGRIKDAACLLYTSDAADEFR
ncbi:MAG: hypothetical protein QUU85_18235, partial [Candidatus Eisenbacteria bacterium]|nr:hypothetical protein [Candidatus Eisenbacteria bacterium]